MGFIDCGRAFGGVDGRTFWGLLGHCGVPEGIASVIRGSCGAIVSGVVQGLQLAEAFWVDAGVGQGCLLSPFMFLLAVDWVVGASAVQGQDGVWWTLWAQFGGLNFAGGLALLLHARRQMRWGTGSIAEVSSCLCVRVWRRRWDPPGWHSGCSTDHAGRGALGEVESFTCLDGIIGGRGGPDTDVEIWPAWRGRHSYGRRVSGVPGI